jgi:hypothetical protein
LAAADMYKAKSGYTSLIECDKIVQMLAAYISASPKRLLHWYQVQRDAGISENDIRRIGECGDTRWLSRTETADRVVLLFRCIQIFLKEEKELPQHAREEQDNKKKLDTLLEQFSSSDFACNLLLYQLVLRCVDPVQTYFQDPKLTVVGVDSHIAVLKNNLDVYTKGKGVNEVISRFQKLITLGGADIRPLTESQKKNLRKLTVNYIRDTIKCIVDRFPNIGEQKVLSMLFDASNIRQHMEKRDWVTYMDDEYLDLLESRFKRRFTPEEYAGRLQDWHTVKHHLRYHLQRYHDLDHPLHLLKWIITNPQFNHGTPGEKDYCFCATTIFLARVALTIPPTTVDVERGFSSMKRIKCPSRSLLKPETLNQLMRAREFFRGDLPVEALNDIARKYTSSPRWGAHYMTSFKRKVEDIFNPSSNAKPVAKVDKRKAIKAIKDLFKSPQSKKKQTKAEKQAKKKEKYKKEKAAKKRLKKEFGI